MTAGLSVSCPNCNTVLVASGAAPMGKCKACGTVFPLYAAAAAAPAPLSTKVCCQCGVDVAHVKRWKDSTGHYYCNPCWDARRAAVAAAMADQSAGASTARPKAPVDECAACGGVFALQDLCDTGGGQILCTACYQQLRSDAGPTPAGYTCAACQQVFDAEQVVDAGDGRIVCQACYAESAPVQCCGCGGSFAPAEVYDDNGQPLCHGCYAARAAGGGEAYEGYADQGGFEAEQPATRECPYCAETINARAIKCRFCGEILDGHSLRGPARTISPVGPNAPAAPQTPPDRFSQFNP